MGDRDFLVGLVLLWFTSMPHPNENFPLVQRDKVFTDLHAYLHFAVTELNSSTGLGHASQVAPGVFIETFNVPVQGDGVAPEINRVYLKSEEKGAH